MATIIIKNIDRLFQKLDNIANVDLKDTMNKAVNVVNGQARALAPRQTGKLSGSISQSVKFKRGNIEGRVFTNVEYAPYVEFGTGINGKGTYPYKIKGFTLKYKNKGWLYKTLDKKDNEKWIYTKGQVAQPFMYPALKNNKKYIKQMFKDAVDKNCRKNCKGG